MASGHDSPGSVEQISGLAAASELSSYLRSGGQPNPIAASIPLFVGEQLYSVQPFSAAEFASQIVNYQRTWIGVGSPLMFAATIGVSAIANQARKQRAVAESAAQWRPLDHGTLYLTNQRFGLQGMEGWVDIHFTAVRNSDIVPNDGIVLFLDGASPLKFMFPWPEYHFLLFQHFAYGRVIDIDASVDVQASTTHAGLGGTRPPELPR